MKRPKVFAISFQYQRPIPRLTFAPHTQFMERPTINELETAREIEDLHSQVRNLRLQLEFATQQNRSLRVRLNRLRSDFRNGAGRMKVSARIYISMLALAETATDTPEYVVQLAACKRAVEANPELAHIPDINRQVQELAEQYRQEEI